MPEGRITYCSDTCRERKHETDKRYRSKDEVKKQRAIAQKKWVEENREKWNEYIRNYNKRRK